MAVTLRPIAIKQFKRGKEYFTKYAGRTKIINCKEIIIGYYTVPKEINFPRSNIKCSGENVIQRGIFQVVTSFPLHFILYCGNLD